jgi:hypothetical protein
VDSSAPIFPISRIADLLGVDRKTVRGYFADAPEGRPLVVHGQTAQGWPVASIPPRLKVRLEKSARDQGYEDIERFLGHARRRWEPAVGVGKIAQPLIELARTRCTALAPVLRRLCDQPISAILREALPAWNCQGRHPVTERTLRRWIERAMERDRGFQDWARWEIYLDDDLAAIPTRPQTAAARELTLSSLEDALASVTVPSCPTATERERIWFQANNDADTLEASGESPAAVQRAVLLALAASGLPLAKTPGALRKVYTRKREAWIAGGRRASALADRRATAAQERAFDLPAEDKLTLLRLALKWSGDLAPAWREAVHLRLLNPATLARFPELAADKSHVPHSIRRAVSLDLAQMIQRNQGPRASRLAGAWTDRDWSGIEAGDWWVGDDLTPPVYFWDEDMENPQPMRGQLLMLADAKTDYVLGWVLLSSRNYNARAIRSLITRCHDEHGLPRQGFHFEYGIWKQSRVLTGQKGDADAVTIEDTETGLSEFGCRFVHATTPGQKTIERVFGLLQDRMEDLPGYCGRDERRDCPEKTRRQLMDVQAGREHPSKYLLEKKALMEEFARIVAAHNAEPHSTRARKIPGQTPTAVYDTRRTEDIMHLGESARYLLATHRIAAKVTKQGIRLRASLGGGLYRNEHTGELIGQTVLVWLDVDAPEAITITTLDRQEPRLIERAHSPRALGAEAWELRTAVDSRRSHMGHGDALYRVVTGGRGRTFRPLVLDRASKQLGEDMQRQKDTAETARRESATLHQKFDRLTQASGISIPKPKAAHRLRAMVEGMQAGEKHWDEVEKQAQEDIDL